MPLSADVGATMQRLRTIFLIAGLLSLTLLLMAPPADAVEGSPLDCPSAVLVSTHLSARTLVRGTRSSLPREPLPATIPLPNNFAPESASCPSPTVLLDQLCVLRC